MAVTFFFFFFKLHSVQIKYIQLKVWLCVLTDTVVHGLLHLIKNYIAEKWDAWRHVCFPDRLASAFITHTVMLERQRWTYAAWGPWRRGHTIATSLLRCQTLYPMFHLCWRCLSLLPALLRTSTSLALYPHLKSTTLTKPPFSVFFNIFWRHIELLNTVKQLSNSLLKPPVQLLLILVSHWCLLGKFRRNM